jgi:nucleoside-diphosphate-sugar epimerase
MSSLLKAMPDARFTVLTRRPGRFAAYPRVQELRCDLTAEGWTRDLPTDLASSVTDILHMAADVRWNVSQEDALATNTRACAQLADWARDDCVRLERFCYVSTAYVEAPSHLQGTPGFIEHEGRFYNNSYEYSKSLGEREVLARGLPTVIVRPSLIVGDSCTGTIGSFNGIYTLLRFASQGLVPIVAGRRDSFVDVVTLDTVVEAVLSAVSDPSLPDGQVIWAISGGEAPRVGDVIEAAITGLNAFRRERGASDIETPTLVPYDTYRRLHRPWFEQQASPIQMRMMEYIDVFTPYFSVTDTFRPDAAHLVVQSPDWRRVFPHAVAYWCEVNEAAALRPPRSWKRSAQAAA